MTIDVEPHESTNSELLALRRRALEQERALAEQARRLAECEAERERLQRIVASVPGVVWEAWGQPDAAAQRIDYVSDYIEPMLGYTVADWLTTPNFWLTIVHPDDQERAGRQAAAIFASGGAGMNLFRWMTKDGRALWVEAHATVIRNAAGQPVGMRGVTLDVSARTEAEAALRRSEERLNGILDSLDDVVWSVDSRSNSLVYISPAAEALYGYSVAELLAEPRLLLSVVHPADRERYNSYTPQLLEHGSIDVEYRIQRPDGSVSWVHDRGWVVRDAHGQIVTINGIVADVTKRVAAEAALRESEARLHSVIASLPIVLYGIDRDGIFTLSEGKGLTALGLQPGQVVGLSAFEIYGEHTEIVSDLRRALAGEAVTSMLDVGDLRFQSWYMPVRDSAGDVTGVLGVSIDVTAQQAAEQETKRLQEEIIRMQAAMLAELSTPLIPIDDQIVVMPLIGALDTQRVRQVLETLLSGITASRARFAILDITGVPVVDTQVANTLIQAARATGLLGARVVLTGIRPEVAQTLVGLGVDLGSIVTRGTLQSGIAYAKSQ